VKWDLFSSLFAHRTISTTTHEIRQANLESSEKTTTLGKIYCWQWTSPCGSHQDRVELTSFHRLLFWYVPGGVVTSCSFQQQYWSLHETYLVTESLAEISIPTGKLSLTISSLTNLQWSKVSLRGDSKELNKSQAWQRRMLLKKFQKYTDSCFQQLFFWKTPISLSWDHRRFENDKLHLITLIMISATRQLRDMLCTISDCTCCSCLPCLFLARIYLGLTFERSDMK